MQAVTHACILFSRLEVANRLATRHVGKPVDEVARMLFVSDRTVHRYAERFLVTGHVHPFERHNGCYCKLSDDDQLLVLELISCHPGMYLRELQAELQRVRGIVVDVSTICRTIRKLGLSRQRITHIALQQSEVKRVEYVAEMSAFDPSTIVWIDETGCDRRSTLRYFGYGIRGLPPQDYQLQLRGMEGIQDVYITEGTVNGDVFLDFIYTQLLPILRPFDERSVNSMLVMDNASIHHADDVVDAICSIGALVRFLPPYSPDYNPIECVFGEVKQ
ncbi:uncharacterized protein [Dysidea avara]|uniref:uncharacterized protein n=1 Tax=Dysidea avara TaxID=196820 RepID=UPI00332A0D45